jgi:uncharacterized protein
VRQAIFDIAIHCTGRVLEVRDLALRRIRLGWEIRPSDQFLSRHRIPSGGNQLDAVLARPAAGEARAGLLICHGIGETVQHWKGVQRLLAENNIASLVFDYSGYGRSSGRFSARQSEEDAIAAFDFLRGQIPAVPVAVLGLSLGSGVAAAVAARVPASGLVLCAAFTSIRDAASSIGLPRWMLSGVPHIWRAEEALRAGTIPTLIVHGEKDRLFPVAMAANLKECCGPHSRVILVPEVGHNAPFRWPDISYWGPIAKFVLEVADAGDAQRQ